MTITLYSNYLNHLQTPFCDEMYKYLGNNFAFISTEKTPLERLNSGYKDCSHYPYNINSYENTTNFNKAIQLGIDSDIVIIGSAPETFIKERLRSNKHTFRYNERFFKKGTWQIFDPRNFIYMILCHTKYRRKNLYMLCASAFTANDLDLFFAYPDKKFKWGYFTEVRSLDIDDIISQKPKGRIKLLWVSRFLKWKHPELAVNLAFQLKSKGYSFHLNMIGLGPMADNIQRLIIKLNLTGFVTLLGGIPNEDVRSYMLNANIFLFTSDRGEGWGAVLNEAMNCGCAIVASDAIGAVPYLINNTNGLCFRSNNLSSLLKQTEVLINDKVLRGNLSRNAYATISSVWTPHQAASNFLQLCSSILNGQDIIFKEGPCSKAKSI